MTPSFLVPIEYVYNDRPGVVMEFLRPLRDGGEVACGFVPGQGSKGIVYAAFDERKRGNEYTDWRFRAMPKSDIWYNYYEIWRPLEGRNECLLFRAYFHVYLAIQSRELVPFACLHCDPNETPLDENDEREVRTCSYKRGPHLHVLRADDPMPSSHFPLNLGHLTAVLGSAESITTAMKTSIDVIHYELVKKWA